MFEYKIVPVTIMGKQHQGDLPLKKIWFLAFLLIFTFAPSALAHSGLVTSVPLEGEVITENISTLSLTFNTTIENTSTFKISGENGQEIPLAEHIVKEKDMIGNLESPLQDGEYTVTWKIIGEDGHPIENSYSFSIVTSNEDNLETLPTEPPVVEEKNNSNSTTEQEIIRENQSTNTNIIMISIIVLLIVSALGTTFWLMKRGKK